VSPGTIGALSVVLVLVLMAFEVPIAAAMAIVGFIGFALVVNPDAAFAVVSKDIFNTFNSYTMSMLVMFILMGYFAFHAGIGSQLYQFAHKTMGYLPGGVAMGWLATSTSAILRRSAARKRMSFTTFGQASASTQMVGLSGLAGIVAIAVWLSSGRDMNRDCSHRAGALSGSD